ncbi:nuclear transport factor 2 family protein [Frankia sp. CNm7]|uniref:Nuclear transport factor 2 family protein n=1 Tax=Frankia nepalensis TaxID=1836974 RepID=A0A937UQ20_9ACTN|nr:nuclear transport factor 2 family protein [Frankia nepalensis]MBL7498417.1 nuclear transport factor 2 family protein [Frankia nepalensis]MBL7509969.1 nuclear transport factor 2 family protein [Frankia nepalensis]MBL7520187.1 nuclear transport factor 2 family protein [Frankia nepalensis]MBL7629747.1 nuclear transport factor 2 family protein [Frankia nepalensis]
MALTAEDRVAITDLVYRYGHLVDAGELDRLGELFTPDVTYDLTDLGHGTLTGVELIRSAALAVGDANPVGHHITNLVLTEQADGQVHARSKGIGIMADGTCGSVVYDDVIVPAGDGWRIRHRKIAARRAPLGGLLTR